MRLSSSRFAVSAFSTLRNHSHLFAITLLFVACLVFAPSKAHAAGVTANTQDCSSYAAGSGDSLKCKMGNVLAKNGALLSNLQTQVTQCTSNSATASDPKCLALQHHLQRAQQAHGRAVNAHNNTSSDDYQQLTLKPSYKGNSGRKGGNNSSVTDTVDSNYDSTGTGQTMSDNLDDASSALDDANNTVLSLATPNPPPFTPGTVYDFTTDDAYPAWLHPELDEKVWIPALFSIKLADKALEMVKTGAESACNETLVVLGEGGNVSLACLPLALAVDALDLTQEMMEFADADLVYWNAKGAYKNAQTAVDVGNQTGQIAAQSAGDIGAIKSEVDGITGYINNTLTPDLDDIKARLGRIEAEVQTNQALLKEVLKTILTPDGKKVLDPGITTCSGTSCPNVLLKCSTSVCAFPIQ